MTNNRPLFLGVDRYMLRACVRRDVPAVVVYGPDWRDGGLPTLPPGFTTVFTEDQRSPEAVLTALTRAGLAGEQFTSVSAISEYAMVNAAVLAQALGCGGLSPEVAVRFRDKSVQKEVVRAHGIPAARLVVVDDLLDAVPDALPFDQCVLKPVAGAATRHTVTLRSRDDLVAAIRKSRAQGGPARTFVMEEFQAGDEWMVDGVMHDGEVIFSSVAEYAQPCLRSIEAKVPVQFRRFDPDTEGWVFALAEPVVRAALAALGLRNGIFHMELFYADGKLVFSECAARRGGGLIHETVECKFGVDLGDAALTIALGERPEVRVTPRPGIVGSTYITAPPGVLFAVPATREIMALPDVEFAAISTPVGGTLPAAVADTVTRIGQVMLRTQTAGRFSERCDEIVDWFASRVTVVPPNLKLRELRALQPALGYPDGQLDTYSAKDLS
jgi:ATP-grasp domain